MHKIAQILSYESPSVSKPLCDSATVGHCGTLGRCGTAPRGCGASWPCGRGTAGLWATMHGNGAGTPLGCVGGVWPCGRRVSARTHPGASTAPWGRGASWPWGRGTSWPWGRGASWPWGRGTAGRRGLVTWPLRDSAVGAFPDPSPRRRAKGGPAPGVGARGSGG